MGAYTASRPETGLLIPSDFANHQRQWTQGIPAPLREQTKERCELATTFVNLRHDIQLKRFIAEHRGHLRPAPEEFLLNLARVLRELWDSDKRETAEENLEQIFADQKAEILRDMKLGQFKRISAFERSFEHPAFKIRLGKASPVFEPRDVLDEIAHAIVLASENNLLKKCEGEARGFRCPTPYLVADEGRRRYCYKNCGNETKAEAKRNPKGGKTK